MAAVLQKSVAFVVVIFIGYLFKARGYLKKEDFYVLSKILLRITLPCAIITNFSSMKLDISLLILCAIGIGMNFIMIFIGYMMKSRRSSIDKETRSFQMINLSGYNIGAFTLPFVQSFFGTSGFAAVSLYDAGNAVMCTGLTYTVAKAALMENEKPSVKQSLKDLLSSVPFDTYVIMTIIAFLNIPVPSFILQITSIGANANTFVAMLMIGVGVELSINKNTVKRLGKLLGVRVAISLLFAFILYRWAPFSSEIRQALVVAVLAPISTVSPAFTGKLGGDIELSSTLNSLSILASIVMITTALITFA
jgi:predicted permease